MKNKCKWPIIISLLVGLSISACDNGNNAGSSGGEDKSMQTGFYLGLIGFNEEAALREVRFLSDGNKDQFQTFVSNLEISQFTGLYYAVDKAINSLQSAKLPDNIKSFTIITFTDGLDDESVSPDFTVNDFETQAEYRAALAEYRATFMKPLADRIAETKIRNLPVRAFSVGLKGADVTAADPEFRNNLIDLASNSTDAYTETSMPNVVKRFITIAENLHAASQEGRSDAVMLVLDCTSSLDENSANGSLYVKDAAYNFINTLLNGAGDSGAGTNTDSAAMLTAGQWKDGNLPIAGSMDYYKVSVSAGIPYYFWWNDKGNLDPAGTKTADVQVSFSADGAVWSSWIDDAWIPNAGYNYPVYRSGTLYIRVRPYSASYTGTYAITYRVYANTRPF